MVPQASAPCVMKSRFHNEAGKRPSSTVQESRKRPSTRARSGTSGAAAAYCASCQSQKFHQTPVWFGM